MTARRSSRLSGLSRVSEAELHILKGEHKIVAHLKSPAELAIELNSDLKNGLTNTKAAARLLENGPNYIGDKVKINYCRILAESLFGLFPNLLWTGAILCFIIYALQHAYPEHELSNENLYLGIVICIVILATGLFGFYHEARNASAMESFQALIPKTARVIREGEKKIIPVEDIVIGDIVEVVFGDMVPADICIVESSNFKIDMSSITGESLPQLRTPKRTSDNPLETQNLAFFSCNAMEGNARGIVIGTGKETVIGRIAGLTSVLLKEKTPIVMELDRFVKIISGFAAVFGILFYVATICVGMELVQGFYYMIGLIIGNIPEGLLITLTVSFTLSIKRLKSKNCLVKHLKAVETLGSTTVICSDKTGTLTQNRMSLSHFAFEDKVIDHSDTENQTGNCYDALRLAACLCLRAQFDKPPRPDEILTAHVTGDASETAVLRFMEAHHNATLVRLNNPKVAEIPFSSVTKYQISIHVLEKKQKHILVMKGAPEYVLALCSTILHSDGEKKLTKEMMADVENQWIKMGHMGERVLGYCDSLLNQDQYPLGFKFNTDEKNFPVNNLRFLGLISLIDPPRPTVPQAIRTCRTAGIQVFMVTGDHPTTALAISRLCGIISPQNKTLYDMALISGKKIPEEEFIHGQCKLNAAVITGDHLRKMSDKELDNIIAFVREITFARTSPQQKLRIVEACQRLGHVVAVTGDGVNDSPALKKADTGIAMGITGTDVSKEAADMILLDDNFSSIVLGIEQGRLIFDNLKKSISYTISSNIAEMIPFLVYIVLGVPLPLQVILIICIDVGTDLGPAMSLSYERPELDIMKRPPRSVMHENLVNGKLLFHAYGHLGIIASMGGFVGYIFILAAYGFYPSSYAFTRLQWDSPRVNDFVDSFGQEWTYEERRNVEMIAQCAYFIGMMETQICGLITCKTRRLSIVHQGCHNEKLFIAIVATICLALIVVYLPGCNSFLNTRPVPGIAWLLFIPFGLADIILDEARKGFFRKYPRAWLVSETGY